MLPCTEPLRTRGDLEFLLRRLILWRREDCEVNIVKYVRLKDIDFMYRSDYVFYLKYRVSNLK